MKRSFFACFIAITILFQSIGVFADIEPDDICVSDPVSNYILLGKQSYLAANIKNFNPESGVRVVISQKFSVVTDEDILKMDLPVSKIVLIAPKEHSFDKRVNFTELNSKEDMEVFESRIKEIILNYFKYKNILEMPADFLIRLPREEIETAKAEFGLWRTKYQLLFERQLFTEVIQSPSYYTSLNWLEEGMYAIRFVDAQGYVVKELSIEVVGQKKDLEYNIRELTPTVIGNFRQ